MELTVLSTAELFLWVMWCLCVLFGISGLFTTSLETVLCWEAQRGWSRPIAMLGLEINVAAQVFRWTPWAVEPALFRAATTWLGDGELR